VVGRKSRAKITVSCPKNALDRPENEAENCPILHLSAPFSTNRAAKSSEKAAHFAIFCPDCETSLRASASNRPAEIPNSSRMQPLALIIG